jgi:hypothetical protein
MENCQHRRFAMPTYRVCVVGPDGRYVRQYDFDAPDSGAATKVALGYVDKSPVELWSGGGLISTLKPPKLG